jgi:serine protease AprX
VSIALPRQGSWRWLTATTLAAFLALATLIGLQATSSATSSTSPADVSGSTPAGSLAKIATEHPNRQVEVIAQFRTGTDPAAAHALVKSADGVVTRELPIIDGLGAEMTAGDAARLSSNPAVESVSLNAAVKSEGLVDPSALATSYNASMRSEKAWAGGLTGKGVGVAVVDTGIQGDLPDFRVSQSDPTSRVIASAVVNPGATTAGDSFGHGTHIAGLIAGNGTNRPAGDPQYGKYAGVAPDANLIDVKIADENGDASVLDVIDGLQFVVDHKNDYNIRVVNLSLKSSVAESYKTDPLDAAVEQAWNAGIVVVVAAGNMGTAPDAVSYAPGNDPYVISVGGVDDMGTKDIADDALAPWSSRGVTQDGFSKPDVVAPGARLVSTMAPNAEYTRLCPTCNVDGGYFRVGGTSMAAGVISGEAALAVQAYPTWTPNQIKALLVKRTRAVSETKSSTGTLVDATGDPVPTTVTTTTTVTGAEAAADKVINNPINTTANQSLVPSSWLDSTGMIDWTRASWSRASWSTAADPLRASWSRASWSRASWSRASWSATPQSCTDFERASWSRASWSSEDIQMAKDQCSTLLAQVDPTRASWSRASWSRASWSSAFDK